MDGDSGDITIKNDKTSVSLSLDGETKKVALETGLYSVTIANNSSHIEVSFNGHKEFFSPLKLTAENKFYIHGKAHFSYEALFPSYELVTEKETSLEGVQYESGIAVLYDSNLEKSIRLEGDKFKFGVTPPLEVEEGEIVEIIFRLKDSKTVTMNIPLIKKSLIFLTEKENGHFFLYSGFRGLVDSLKLSFTSKIPFETWGNYLILEILENNIWVKKGYDELRDEITLPVNNIIKDTIPLEFRFTLPGNPSVKNGELSFLNFKEISYFIDSDNEKKSTILAETITIEHKSVHFTELTRKDGTLSFKIENGGFQPLIIPKECSFERDENSYSFKCTENDIFGFSASIIPSRDSIVHSYGRHLLFIKGSSENREKAPEKRLSGGGCSISTVF